MAINKPNTDSLPAEDPLNPKAIIEETLRVVRECLRALLGREESSSMDVKNEKRPR